MDRRQDIAYFKSCITSARDFKNTHYVIYRDENRREYRVRRKLTERQNGEPIHELKPERFVFMDVHLIPVPGVHLKHRRTAMLEYSALPRHGDVLRLHLWNVHKDDTTSIRQVDARVVRVYPGIVRPFENTFVEDLLTTNFGLVLFEIEDGLRRSICFPPTLKQKKDPETVDYS